ncbi:MULTISPECIES: GDSL-type esterase/lipase family protein [unclassified Fibrobacter]|uniref:GDSL-type esterase/lipase family protein n=1 Tax=unclassified Fibrobacter TaxID=2634177 RepID=UPI000D6A863F|nr:MULTISPECIES: GDSL-type esterase/lipase family protein [unclassified Fibrobacter]PWJ60794.1 lysophospholipase L1-like esterase [Fibrobacter sp. UWR4]PZW64655.1 lysophospholipase L1-like esterase [Fibrobacter sp. UWR1]
MTPLKTLLSILSLFVVLGLMAIVYPEKGISVGDFTLRFPALTDIFVKDDGQASDSSEVAQADPEAVLKEMLEATRQKEFAEFSDSLNFYEEFFQKGRTRFDLPNNDPTWFDRFFLHLELAEMDSTVVHIVHYGDSQLEEDRISSTIREDLQSKFGGNGPGLLPPILNTPSMNTSYWNSGDLKRFMVYATADDMATHNRYGILAQMAELNGNAVIGLKKRVERKDKFPHVGGYATIKVLAGKRGNLKLKLTYESSYQDSVGVNEDGTVKYKKKTKTVDAGAPQVEKMNKLAVYTWKLADTTSSAKINLSGNTDIYAIAADGKYGVAVDNVAMRGSSGTMFHKIDAELLAESYRAMNARLIIMEYGGNLVPGTSSKNIDWTKKIITKQIKTIQEANPNADILFIGPADMAKQVDGKWQTYPALNMTIKALREVALENGLAYWDMHRVMGGNGSIMKWVKKEPPLGFTDHVHFTRRGAAYMGDLFSEALKMHYDYFKFRDRHDISDAKLKEIHEFKNAKTKDAAAEAAPKQNSKKAPETKK